ncbi:MAG: DNA-directed RNA polymerase subunit beta' [Candidatus Atribacteria bacterium]|nr:DNA-directed RNA polymerase subunit beta' [Candidatus Atribacteria bacterium]
MVDVNDLGAIQIGLASPEEIRKWSRGEVKKPETINYRTLKPEKDGLFCEKIFGPTKDWECYCGKYKRVKDKGMVCDRCGVEITKASVRRERLGHIELATPVSHIWYFKSIPSKMALLLGIIPKNLEKVLYFASGRKREDCYKVIDPGSTDLEAGETIRETEYKIYSKYDPGFRAEPAHRIVEVHSLPFSIGDRLTLKDYTRYRSKYKDSFTAEPIDENHFEVVDIKVFPYQRDEELSESEVNQLREVFGGLFEENVLSDTVEEPCYIVVNPGKTGLKVSQMILETEARLLSRYDPEFKAGVGAEAVREILKNIDVHQLARELRKELKESSGAKAKKLIKRLQVVESFCKSGNRPEWMILEVIPVLPPDLRPMVQLDGGRFATSDLNDLYRRVINRNNRLKRLLQLGAPEIIVKNEKRMLQEAVDALFDNGRRGRPVLGPGNRPLKSLSDMLRGKKGRFRQNLLGKRVDYSGRSVIVSGPRLRFDQCGIPKKMALELFKPFVMKKLVDKGFAHNIKSAKRMVEKVRDEVWGILEEVIAEHPVLLNRAPTLHRLSIQAFQPVLVEGNAIQLHPLVCPAFNADFDGDQMAVHVPLSAEAQAEAQIIMLSSHNILSPAHGKPIAVPTQDMVLGCYYLTLLGTRGERKKIFRSVDEAMLAYSFKKLDLHEPIFVKEIAERHPEVRETTVGRIIFNQVLPEGMPYYNEPITKKKLSEIVDLCYRSFGNLTTVQLLDRIKELGFHYATKSGSTIGVLDLEIPAQKTEIIEEATRRVEEINEHYNEGLITGEEREQKVIDVWTDASNKIADAILRNLSDFNPVNMMAKSGARGSIRQVSQLAGMRGLMADPSGRIIEYPIRANFREGLSVLEYFISTHGARKGLADTALRTAKSGYLTRRLVDVAQDVIVREEDCGTDDGVLLEDLRDESDNVVEAFEDRVLGRIALRDVIDEKTGEVLVKANEEIDEKVVERFKERGIKKAWVRSVLTCKTRYGVCVKCYGRNLATGRLVDIGEAVGIVAAQSIGEPGTQLTMRTFHTGGIRIAGEDITQGLPRVEQLFEVRKPKKAAVLSEVDGVVEKIETIGNRRKIYVRPSEDEEDQTVRTYFVPHDVRICVVEGDTVKAGERLTLGPINPRDILKIKGIRAVQKYLLEEIQSVYVSQGVNINDKHIEVIIRQIARLNKIMVENAGNTGLLSGEMVFLEDFEKENARILSENQALLENTRNLLEGRKLGEDVLDISGETILRKGEILEEPAIQQILSVECKSFLIEKGENMVRVIRGYRNLEHELLDRICVEEVKDKDGKTLIKAGETLRPALLDHIAEVGPVNLRIREKTTWEKLKGSILAEDVVSRKTNEVLIPAHTRLENEQIELLQKHDVEQVVVWKNVKSFPIKENLVKVLRDEILGKEVAKDIVSPQTGEVIIPSGQTISRGSARRLVSEGIREIPLRDGRFFSIEGRLIEMLEQEIVGKVAAQDVILGNSGTVLIKAGEIIDREDVARIAEDNISLLFLRDIESEKEVKTLVEEVIYLPGLKHVATGRPIVLGITKASLAVESFLSAASFQQTTHVLADSAIKGKVDELIGLKENVIIGKVIPSGTGCNRYRKIRLSTEGEVVAQEHPEMHEDLIRDLMGAKDVAFPFEEEFGEGFVTSDEDDEEEHDFTAYEEDYEDNDDENEEEE